MGVDIYNEVDFTCRIIATECAKCHDFCACFYFRTHHNGHEIKLCYLCLATLKTLVDNYLENKKGKPHA